MTTRPSLTSAVAYRDPAAALDWLESAFGFSRCMVIRDADGKIEHAEMRFGDSYVMVGPEWYDSMVSPMSSGGRCTQTIHVDLKSGPGVDAHCVRAEAAGAQILMIPTDQFYGDRVYRARDPEGHVWVFGQTMRTVSREEAQQATGLDIEGWI